MHHEPLFPSALPCNATSSSRIKIDYKKKRTGRGKYVRARCLRSGGEQGGLARARRRIDRVIALHLGGFRRRRRSEWCMITISRQPLWGLSEQVCGKVFHQPAGGGGSARYHVFEAHTHLQHLRGGTRGRKRGRLLPAGKARNQLERLWWKRVEVGWREGRQRESKPRCVGGGGAGAPPPPAT